MLRALRKKFESILDRASNASDPQSAEQAYRLATATLLVEMSRADFEVHPVESRAVEAAIMRAFGLSSSQTRELTDQAHRDADHATSLHEFTSLINEHFSPEQKFHLVELLWEVAFADGEVDRYEEHLVRKIADLVYVRHHEFIRAKLNAQSRQRASRADPAQ